MNPVNTQVRSASSSSIRVVAILFFCLGSLVGFGAGVLSVKASRDFFASMFGSERAADVKTPLTIDRPAFTFQYPSNWKVDIADKDYDADHEFSVDSPGQSFVMFQIMAGDVEPLASVTAMANAQTSKVMKGASLTSFTTWGTHTGAGILLRGKHLGMTAAQCASLRLKVAGRRSQLQSQPTTTIAQPYKAASISLRRAFARKTKRDTHIAQRCGSSRNKDHNARASHSASSHGRDEDEPKLHWARDPEGLLRP
jgi:hypothetical protein